MELRDLVIDGQRETTLHVDLLALREEFNSSQSQQQVVASEWIQESAMIEHIPICFPTSNADRPMTPTLKPKQYQLLGYTQIRSEYMTEKGEKVSEAFRVHEWIHYHRYQGVEHFIIYDNDIVDHGPLEEALQPYIEEGLVTRIWNPSNETFQPKTDKTKHVKGKYAFVIQASMENAALWRYGYTTEYFMACDIDEYFLPRDSHHRLSGIVQDIFSKNPKAEVQYWLPYVVTYCNGTVLSPSSLIVGNTTTTNDPFDNSPMATRKCRTNSRLSGAKLILRADRIWLFHTHDAFLNSEWKKPIKVKIPMNTGFLAHYRRRAYETVTLPDGNLTILSQDQADDPTMSNLDLYLETRMTEIQMRS